MPVFEMPLEKLQKYKGTNPRPQDFDDYWDRGLTEMRNLDPNVVIEPADFQTPFAECCHLYFTGVAGARIHAKLLRPKGADSPHPAVVMFHGYTGDSGDWIGKLGYAAMGYTVAAIRVAGRKRA